MNIGGREIGDNQPVFIIAELSANHNGSLKNAIDAIIAAKQTGADAIKLQTYTADTITLDVKSEDFMIKTGKLWRGRYLHDLYQEAHTPWEWHKELFHIAKEEGLVCFSSPFDKTAVDFLENLDAPAYKIASFEITDIPLIKYVASKKKPIIISTGIADEHDIKLAIDTCNSVNNNDIALLKCTSSYPASMEEANLSMISYLKEEYGVIPGLSDHTLGLIAPVVATTLGAKIIEKHFITNKSIGGPDAAFSLDKREFTEMVNAVRNAESSIGQNQVELSENKKESRKFSRSIYVSNDVKKGDIVASENVRSVRPGLGLHPKYMEEILGRKFNLHLKKGTALKLDHISQG